MLKFKQISFQKKKKRDKKAKTLMFWPGLQLPIS